MSYKRSSLRNQKAKLAADYNELLKELSSREMTSIGCYTIGETIGEGTFGKVKIGTHKLTGQQVAVKKISKQHASMIAREIHHHRQLHHSNIVRIYEIIVTESSIHIFSEYCPNGELFDLLASTGRFSESRVQLWMQQLTSALQLCHSQGIVHRDLKLENILLDIDNNCKICDFGFARFADNKQLLETFCGSLAYSAPEVIMRQKYTGPETDIWSLGVILYTLLAGELPFDDDSEITTQRKIVNVDYQMPHYFSPYSQDLIANMLKRDPADRLTMDQIINHPWMLHCLEDNTSTSSNNTSELDIHNNPTASTSTSTNGSSSSSSSSSSDDDDEVEDDIDSDGCSASTRYSSRSDLDSIFSNPRFRNDLMEEDEDDMLTEASFSSFNSDHFNGKSGDITHHQQQQHNRKYHGAVSGSANYTDGSKFSPQVRFSLGMLRPEEKVKYSSRSPRFSAPTVSNRSMTSSQPTATFRSSLPLSLSSNRESIRPSSISSIASVDSPMNATEQRLATTLVAAGFDEYIVHSMRGNTCGTANTLWNMLLEKQRHYDTPLSSSSAKTLDGNDRWSVSSSSIRKQHFPLANTQVASVDSSSQTVQLPPTATMVDRMTQTDTAVLTIDLDKSPPVDTSKMTISPRRPSLASSHRSYSSFTNTVHNKPSHQSISSVASLSSMSSTTSEKSGWLTSVKSWFGGSANKQEGGIYDAPLRPSQLRRQIQQQQQQQQLASYRDFDSHLSPHSQNSNIDSQDELAPPIYRSGTLKYRRHMLQLDEWNQQPKTTDVGQPNHHRQTVQHPGMETMLAPPPPTATTTPRPTADNLSIITTPKYVSSTAIPSHVTEVDICEKRNPMYHRPLPPPAPPAPIYTNSSKNSNNRLCYQNQYLPPQKKQPSPPLSPHDVEPTLAIHNRATPTNSTSPAPLPDFTPHSKVYPTPSSSVPVAAAPAAKDMPSFPVQKEIRPVLPPTPPTTEDEGNEKDITTVPMKESAIKDLSPSAPKAAASTLPGLDMQILKPHSSKSSPTLLPSSVRQTKGSPIAPRRFEFTPRSRLSVYGMNERGSMANKAIIEEEEEEEE